MLGQPLSLCTDNCMYLTNYDTERINKIPKCFSCPGDRKELSMRSTHDSNQARTKPWPTRPTTSDNNSPITERIRIRAMDLAQEKGASN